MNAQERADYIESRHRDGIGTEDQIREYLPLLAGKLGNSYAGESHIRAGRYTHDVEFLLGEIDRYSKLLASEGTSS